MKITFACPQCGKPLVADAALAGRTGRCRHCGHRAVVPNGQQPSGGTRQPAAGKGSAGSDRPAAQAPAADWRAAVASQLPASAPRDAAAGRTEARPASDATDSYSLRPVTPVGVPALAASDWDNAELGPAVVAPPTVFTSPTFSPPPPARARPIGVATKPAGPRLVAAIVMFPPLIVVAAWVRLMRPELVALAPPCSVRLAPVPKVMLPSDQLPAATEFWLKISATLAAML